MTQTLGAGQTPVFQQVVHISGFTYHMKLSVIFLMTCTFYFSCASAPQSRSTVRYQQNVILRNEIIQGQNMNIIDLISAFRPQWFNSRSIRSQTPPNFYIDGNPVYYIDQIYQMPTRNALMIEYISPFDPTVMGIDSRYGAVLITLFKQ